MHKKVILILVALVVFLAVVYIALSGSVMPPGDGSSPTSTPSNASSTDGNTTGLPLALPEGFSISTFAKDLPHARMMAWDAFGNIWVSQPQDGIVSTLEIDQESGALKRQDTVFRSLNKPHGLAFDPANPHVLYIAEENKVSRVTTYSDDQLHKLVDLPVGGNHWTRTIGFGPDKRIYVSMGSTCNVCHEPDNRRAAIFSMNPDGSNFTEFARGLRNSVFFAWHPTTGQMWATEMGRDNLGDDMPPDEINILAAGKNYGWPICYGKNLHDTAFDKNTYIRNPCMDPFEAGSTIDLQAHSAPLGLAFVPMGAGWPADYEGDLLVAYHGSWNRTVPTGYKIVRHKFSASGRYEGMEDFVTGWIQPGDDEDEVRGRPVHLLFDKNGLLFVTDDKAGVIYKIQPPA